MSEGPRKVIALGSPTGEHRSVIDAAARAVGAEAQITRESARALTDAEASGALAVLFDVASLGAEHFCRKVRASERLRSTPLIALSRNPGEASSGRVFAWGADDLVPIAEAPLTARLQSIAGASENSSTSVAVVAEASAERSSMLARVLSQAGYEVKSATQPAAVEALASEPETRLVVMNAAVTAPRKLIDNVEASGALPMWVVMADSFALARVTDALAAVRRATVTSSGAPPEDVLFLANDLVFARGNKRSEPRALHGAVVRFREPNATRDEFGACYDLSRGGLYIRTLLPVDFDDVWLEIEAPNRERALKLRGKITRRSRFGSGAIASAPPGFGVKLESGDEGDLAFWSEAAEAFVQTATAARAAGMPRTSSGMMSKAQRPGASIAPGYPSLPPALGGAIPVRAAVPVVLSPNPEAMSTPNPTRTDIDRLLDTLDPEPSQEPREPMNSDVAQMLHDTLEQEELPASGANPVMMSFENTGVFESVPPDELKKAAEAAAAPGANAASDATDAAPAAVASPIRRIEAMTTPAEAPGVTPENQSALAEIAAKAIPPAAGAPPPAPMRSHKATLVMGMTSPVADVPLTETPAATPPSPAAAPDMPPGFGQTAVLGSPSPFVAGAPVLPATPAPTAAARTKSATPPPLPATTAPATAPAASPQRGGGGLIAAALGFLAIVGVVVAAMAFGLLPGLKPKAATPGARPTAVLSTRPTETSIAATTPEPSTSSPVVSPVPSESALPAASDLPLPSASAPPEAASAAPAPSAAVPSVAPAASVPVPQVDLSQLKATQAYLFVHSTVQARVYVLGNDAGATNELLLVSCGTRFVRLGRKFADFLEPGGPVIIKCGALTETTIEPTP